MHFSRFSVLVGFLSLLAAALSSPAQDLPVYDDSEDEEQG